MKKLIIGLILLNFAVTEAKETLRVEDSITVTNGKVSETGVLADNNGTIFLEFLKGSFINYTKDNQPFSGEILAPSIIDNTQKLPRGRMREILTFELLSDNADEVSLVDRYTLMHPKEYLRETISNPDGLIHNGGIKLLTRLYNKDKIGFPGLWKLETKKAKDNEREINYWKRVGGKLNESPESDVKVFTAIISKTGVYGLFDENPKPFYSKNTPLETVEKVQQSPFPSVVPQPQIKAVDKPLIEENLPLDEWGDDDFQIPDDTLIIPAVQEPKKIDSDTLIIPAIETDEEMPLLEELPEKNEDKSPTDANRMHASNLDINDIKMLPVAGEKKISSRFPIILILSFFVIGFSIYLAIKKDYKVN